MGTLKKNYFVVHHSTLRFLTLVLLCIGQALKKRLTYSLWGVQSCTVVPSSEVQ